MSLASDLCAALDPAEVFRQAFVYAPLDWQTAYLRTTGNVVVLKGRQIGASLAAAALAIHGARYWPDSNVVIVSPSLKQSTEILTKARNGLRNLDVRLEQDSSSMLRLTNGARILSLPGTARSVRGWTARLLILDEAAFIEPATFIAARALVATGGRVIVQSTPAIEAGDFHELVTGADAGWQRFTVRSDEVSTISPEFLASERAAMSPEAFSTEYLCAFGKLAATPLFTTAQVETMFTEPEAIPA
ncbi:MAG TPA: terminase family protein [Candidatus Limnocylindrales bacterium]